MLCWLCCHGLCEGEAALNKCTGLSFASVHIKIIYDATTFLCNMFELLHRISFKITKHNRRNYLLNLFVTFFSFSYSFLFMTIMIMTMYKSLKDNYGLH